MTVYSYGQLESLWTNAGGPKSLAPLMAAIAMAESGGRSDALNLTDNGGRQTSVGLWQVSSGTHSYPSSWTTPQGNAAEAVAKYKSQGLGAWGTYTSGAYLQFLKGNVPASAVPQGGSGGGSGTQQGQTTAAGSTPGWLIPIEATSGPIGWIAAAGTEIGGLLTGGVGTAQSFEGLWKSADTFVKEIGAVLKGIEWLFVPTHWVRIGAFLFGVGFGIPGISHLAKAGQGDMSLAVGILLTVLSGLMFFIAFHNLPDDITSISDLMTWLSDQLQHKSYPPATVTV
jgi:hypothetical protein